MPFSLLRFKVRTFTAYLRGLATAFTRFIVTGRMSWKFEIACVTYNMAVLESQSGAITDRSSEDGIRKANRHFSVGNTG